VDREEFRSYLERGKSVLSAKAKDEQELKDNARNSLLPYFLFWLTNLGVANGLPRYTALMILIQVSILFIPEFAWISIGVEGKKYVLDYPEFIQYFVLNSTFPNAMFMFWLIAPFVFILNAVLYFMHIHFRGFQSFLARRDAKLKMSGKSNDCSFAIQLLIFVLLYAWVVFGNINPPSFLGGFVPLKNRLAMSVFHGIQISLVIPAVLTLLTAELRVSFKKLIQK
jgi:hypothetical protein